jgi:hypothetical protein
MMSYEGVNMTKEDEQAKEMADKGYISTFDDLEDEPGFTPGAQKKLDRLGNTATALGYMIDWCPAFDGDTRIAGKVRIYRN